MPQQRRSWRTAKHTGARVSGPITPPTDREMRYCPYPKKRMAEQCPEAALTKRQIDILKPSKKTDEAHRRLSSPLAWTSVGCQQLMIPMLLVSQRCVGGDVRRSPSPPPPTNNLTGGKENG